MQRHHQLFPYYEDKELDDKPLQSNTYSFVNISGMDVRHLVE